MNEGKDRAARGARQRALCASIVVPMPAGQAGSPSQLLLELGVFPLGEDIALEVVVNLLGVDLEVVDDEVLSPVLDEEEDQDHGEGCEVQHDLARRVRLLA